MNRLVVAVASIGLLGVALSPSARADEWNKKTVMTVNEPIQVPNKVLPAGHVCDQAARFSVGSAHRSDLQCGRNSTADDDSGDPELPYCSRPARPCSRSGKRLPDNPRL